MSISSKNISLSCNSVKKNIIITKNIVSVLLIFFIIISFLFYLSVCPSKLHFAIYSSISKSRLDIPFSDKNGNITNETITDSHNSFSNYWYIDSIELYFSSIKAYISSGQMIDNLIYQKGTVDISKLNTLSIMLYKSVDNQHPKNIWTNNQHTVPNEYSLSYLVINLKSSHPNYTSNINFYYFFQNDKNTETKLNLITYVELTTLRFDESSYTEWYNWKFNNKEIGISTYPFMANVTFMCYTYVENPLNNKEYILGW